jgi:hypothetical protein
VHPMAVVILGGLVTSTCLALFLLPALYLRFGAGAGPRHADEEDLLERWLGVEPAPAAATAGPHAGPPPQDRRPSEAGDSAAQPEQGTVP